MSFPAQCSQSVERVSQDLIMLSERNLALYNGRTVVKEVLRHASHNFGGDYPETYEVYVMCRRVCEYHGAWWPSYSAVLYTLHQLLKQSRVMRFQTETQGRPYKWMAMPGRI